MDSGYYISTPHIIKLAENAYIFVPSQRYLQEVSRNSIGTLIGRLAHAQRTSHSRYLVVHLPSFESLSVEIWGQIGSFMS